MEYHLRLGAYGYASGVSDLRDVHNAGRGGHGPVVGRDCGRHLHRDLGTESGQQDHGEIKPSPDGRGTADGLWDGMSCSLFFSMEG